MAQVMYKKFAASMRTSHQGRAVMFPDFFVFNYFLFAKIYNMHLVISLAFVWASAQPVVCGKETDLVLHGREDRFQDMIYTYIYTMYFHRFVITD